MSVYTSALALSVLLLLLAPGAWPVVDSAAACQMRSVPDPWDRLSTAATSDSTELVVVGSIVQERRVERTAEGYVELDYDSSAEYGSYWSIVKPEAVLAGQVRTDEIRMPMRFKEWQCVGGPRLREGDRMLLFLYRDPVLSDHPDGFVWNTQLVGGQVLLNKDEAYLTDYQATGGQEHIGTAQELITRIAAMVGSSSTETEAALVAARKPSREFDRSGSPALLIAALISTGLILGLAGAYLRHRVRAT